MFRYFWKNTWLVWIKVWILSGSYAYYKSATNILTLSLVYFNYVVSLLPIADFGVKDEGIGALELPKPNLERILFP